MLQSRCRWGRRFIENKRGQISAMNGAEIIESGKYLSPVSVVLLKSSDRGYCHLKACYYEVLRLHFFSESSCRICQWRPSCSLAQLWPASIYLLASWILHMIVKDSVEDCDRKAQTRCDRSQLDPKGLLCIYNRCSVELEILDGVWYIFECSRNGVLLI